MLGVKRGEPVGRYPPPACDRGPARGGASGAGAGTPSTGLAAATNRASMARSTGGQRVAVRVARYPAVCPSGRGWGRGRR